MLKEMDVERTHLSLPEAAKQSGLSRVYLAQLLRTGPIEGFRLGREGFVYTDSLQKFLATDRRTGPKGSRKTSAQRTVQLSLNFAVTTEDEAALPLSGENASSQQHLLLSLLHDPDTLNTYLLRQIAVHLAQVSWEEWHTLLLGRDIDNQEVLVPLLERLNPNDKDIFLKALARGDFYEQTETVRDHFHLSLERVSVKIRKNAEKEMTPP